MYRKIEDFISDWKEEEKFTEKFFGVIKEESKSTKINENVRSLEKLAWHITQTLTEMPHKAGIFESDFLENQPIPSTVTEIIEINKNFSKKLIEALKAKWNDDMLEDKVNMYGEDWRKGKILSILIGHQVHHRAQMAVIMSMLGLKVPGYFGPSKEEWIEMGLPPME